MYIKGMTRNDVIGCTEVALPKVSVPTLPPYHSSAFSQQLKLLLIPTITTVIANTVAIMPVHPSEEQAPSGIYDQIAKDPTTATDSTASDHPLHQGDNAGNSKATAQDFQSKGPAIPQSMNGKTFVRFQVVSKEANQVEDMPPKASKEELKARSEELNK